ncbi:MAG: hypothetical protein GY786_07585 [Proteobacteria bacterium]|nr:hypothetical protein [Pseudomonadota bacterium]
MNYTLSLRNINSLEQCCSSKVSEVLIYSAEFSKTGDLESTEIDPCLSRLKTCKKRVIFVWDLLCKDNRIDLLGSKMDILIDKVDAVRFLDPGVGSYLASRYPGVKLQFSLEKGTFNKKGILEWAHFFSRNLERIILSNQLPISQVREICSSTDVDIELPGIGRIEIFNSPRPLVQTHLPGLNGKKVVAASEDRPHQLSPLIENPHGTIMYYDKDLFVLDMLDEIVASGVKYLGLDFFDLNEMMNFNRLYHEKGWISKLRALWPKNTTRGFLRANKSHVPLKRLTNRHLQKEKENKVGVVLESVKKVHLLIELGLPINLPAVIDFYTPEGKVVGYEVRWAKDLNGIQQNGRLDKGFYLFPWIKFVVPATILKGSSHS